MGVMRATDQVTIVEGGIGDTTELETKIDELNNNLSMEIIKGGNITISDVQYNTEKGAALFTPDFNGVIYLSVTVSPYDYWKDGKEYRTMINDGDNYVYSSNRTSIMTQNYTNLSAPWYVAKGAPFYISVNHWAQGDSITFKASYRMLVVKKY